MTVVICKARNPATCRVHGVVIEKGLRNQDEETLWTLKTFNQDYEFNKFFLNQEHLDALRSYTGITYIPINKYLYDKQGFLEDRLAKVKSEEDLQKHEAFLNRIEKLIGVLDDAFQSSKEIRQRRLFRSFKVPGTSEALPHEANYDKATLQDMRITEKYLKENFKVGSEVTFPTYLSTSIDASLMANNIREEDQNSHIVFEIFSKKGIITEPTPLAQEQGYVQTYEREVTLPRNLKFKVTSISRNVKFEPSPYSHDPREHMECYVVRLEEVIS